MYWWGKNYCRKENNKKLGHWWEKNYCRKEKNRALVGKRMISEGKN